MQSRVVCSHGGDSWDSVSIDQGAGVTSDCLPLLANSSVLGGSTTWAGLTNIDKHMRLRALSAVEHVRYCGTSKGVRCLQNGHECSMLSLLK